MLKYGIIVCWLVQHFSPQLLKNGYLFTYNFSCRKVVIYNPTESRLNLECSEVIQGKTSECNWPWEPHELNLIYAVFCYYTTSNKPILNVSTTALSMRVNTRISATIYTCLVRTDPIDAEIIDYHTFVTGIAIILLCSVEL